MILYKIGDEISFPSLDHICRFMWFRIDFCYFLAVNFYICRYYDDMVVCYEKIRKIKNISTRDKGKHDKIIAALICHENGKSPYTAILSTGVHKNDKEKCYLDGSCDGHAPSIIYAAAPNYFMDEMLKAQKGEESIFYPLTHNAGFVLKSGVTFHLLVTEPPCGFIRNQEDPCMEWKMPFAEFPHIPTCSSRILIGATMGIQGYVSHLINVIEKPILIESVIIFCGENFIQHQRTDFGNVFPLPIIKSKVYNPTDIKPNFRPMHLVKIIQATESHETSDTVLDAKCTRKWDGWRDSLVAMADSRRHAGPSILTLNPQKGTESTLYSNFSIKKQDIDECLQVDKNLEVSRKSHLKWVHNKLFKELNVETAAKVLLANLKAEIEKKRHKIFKCMHKISEAVTADNYDVKTLNISEWNRCIYGITDEVNSMKIEGQRKIDDASMIAWIEKAMQDNNLIMDCIWHQYINDASSSVQPLL